MAKVPGNGFDQALAAHGRGDFPAAIAGYRSVLARLPRHVDALNLLGVALLAVGDASAAVTALRKVVAIDAGFAAARVNLALALRAIGDPAAALPHFRQAVRIAPNDPDTHHALGSELSQLGQDQEAMACFRQALALAPDHAPAAINLSALLERAGLEAQAIDMAEQACRHAPSDPQAWIALGLRRMAATRFVSALEAFHRAAALDPRSLQAASNQALALYHLKRFAEAIAQQRLAVANAPTDRSEQVQLAEFLLASGDLAAAEGLFERLVEDWPADSRCCTGLALCIFHRTPEQARALLNRVRAHPPRLVPEAIRWIQALHDLGEKSASLAELRALEDRDDLGLLERMLVADRYRNIGQYAEQQRALQAIVTAYPTESAPRVRLATALYDNGALDAALTEARAACVFAPNDASAHDALGFVLQGIGRSEEAEVALRRAMELDPLRSEVHSNLGNTLRILNRLSEAAECYRRSIELAPESPFAFSNLATTLMDLGELGEAVTAFRAALERRPDWSEGLSNLIFAMGYMPQFTAADHLAERRRWWDSFGAPLYQPRTFDNVRSVDRPLRVGYVSADFRHHAAGYVLAPILFNHDPNVVQSVCYYGGSVEDDMTERFRAAAAEWQLVLGLSDDALADLIRRDRIDILVDVSGHTAGNRLKVFARKPAPVQVHAWGQLGGTGLETIDYMLADPMLIPAADRPMFAETVVDLPCWIAFQTPDREMLIDVAPAPALAGGGITFGCFNRLAKVTPPVVALWARVLAAIPDARLLMKTMQFDEHANVVRMRAAFAAEGIDPDRLRFRGRTPRRDHLAAYGEIDIQLDPFPQAGGVTTLESLWMGVPSIALPMQSPSSRATAAIQASIGLGHLNARDEADYVRIAVALAADTAGLAALRRDLRSIFAAHPVGNALAYTRAVEDTYRHLWRAWCTGAQTPA